MYRRMTNAKGSLEIWGGIECTVNRIGDRYCDQIERSGHYGRLSDLDRIAALGVKTVRYPAIWEQIMPDGPRSSRWRRTDEALTKIRDLGMTPIVGLLHHGSGPSSTDLLDPQFARAFSDYAAAFAARYPWVCHYTPINEPLTTARFCALYGHWFPHHRSDRSFVTALLNQCRAIVEGMRRIRDTTPEAQLVQTEDAASTRGTLALAEQVAFENERRWVSFDLIGGRMTEAHRLWSYLVRSGASRRDLEWLATHGIAPDIIGLNYYVTSDRYLDHRVEQYPLVVPGGNDTQRYVDVGAAHIPGLGILGHRAMLEAAWARYRLPIVITEAHLGCTREEQMRWLMDAWRGAEDARSGGADVRAVTTWAMLGSWDWDSLVTVAAGHYEPGAFDIRSGDARSTAVAGMVSEFAAGRVPSHPVLAVPGWWRRTGKVVAPAGTRPLMITGCRGTLGRALVEICAGRGLAVVALSRDELDITNPDAVGAAVQAWRPWAIVNAAGYVKVDQAEREASVCRRTNAIGPAILAAVCRRERVQLLTFSSDLVFDGASSGPYLESDLVSPQNIYGRTKAEAERRVLALNPAALVIRTGAFFGPWDSHNFLTVALRTMRDGRPFRAASDLTVSPTYLPDLVTASLDLLIDGAPGIWHLANAGSCTWAEFAAAAARAAGVDDTLIEPCDSTALALAAHRPRYSVLGTERGMLLPPLDHAIARYAHDLDIRGIVAA
jgi:dTDP-4-dehydrorhamnose reductase